MYVFLRKMHTFYYLLNTDTLRVEKFSDINAIKSSVKRVRDCNKSFLPFKYESQDVYYIFNQLRTRLYLWFRGYSFVIDFNERDDIIYVNDVEFCENRGNYVMFMYINHNRLILHMPYEDLILCSGRVLDSNEIIDGRQCSQSSFKREVLLKCFM